MARQPGKRKAQQETQDDGIEVEIVDNEEGGQDQGAVAKEAAADKAREAEVEVATEGADDGADRGPSAEELAAWKKAHDEAEDIRKARDAAEQRAADAERRAREADDRANAAGKSTIEAKTAAITNSMETLKARAEAFEEAIVKAQEAGDFRASAKATAELTKVHAQLLTLEDGKSALAEQAKQPAPRPSSEVEAQIQGLSPRQQDWFRKNPEYALDGSKQKRVVSAHYAALAQDIVPESETYFRFIEEQVGIRQKAAPATDTEDDDGEVEVETAPRQPAKGAARKGAVAAAPVSRGSGGGLRTDGGARPSRVTLTPGEVATAERLGMSQSQYAKRKLEYQARERARGNIR